MKTRACLILVFGVLLGVCSAQIPDRNVVVRPEVHCEAHALPSSDAATVSIVVLYSMCNDLLTFTHNIEGSRHADFEAAYSCRVECADSLGVIRFSKVLFDTISVDTYEQTNSTQYTTTRRFVVSLPKGPYAVRCEFEQLNGAFARYRSRLLQLSPTQLKEPISDVILLSSIGTNSCVALSAGGGIEFASSNVQFIAQLTDATSAESWSYRCSRSSTKDEFYPGTVSELSGKCTVRRHTRLDAGDPLLLNKDAQLAMLADSSSKSAVVLWQPETSTLTPGLYSLRLFRDNAKDTIFFTIECRWSAMPACLRSVSATITAMSYIMTEQELDDLTDGSDREMRKKLVNWWKKKDPTPRTPYNEAMQAFFRRADESRTAYMSPVEPDGLKTERARVYTLYGSPTDIQASTNTGQLTREVWTYTNKVRKRIVFEADGRGVYKIVHVEPL